LTTYQSKNLRQEQSGILRVEGICRVHGGHFAEAHWLRDRLAQASVCRTCTPMFKDEVPAHYSFCVVSSSQPPRLNALLTAIPDAGLSSDAVSTVALDHAL
jgi:hypothetical protein